ncbi:MAG: 23S rRNA (pseudouridine(1915)-N(3))-methyltransferase RlmH [Candidatus Peribacteraceae bacterium]|jgi:23S rRNA (pseudouridine1915-N3)-methyltransferase|nr:23S rRNA (pseudouridine(1915)-N(3))-methyltransferase RlmH [Candidatus Peribacteraceae bacterium]
MQKVTLLCVGPIRTKWIAEGCAHFSGRLGHAIRMEVVEVPASRQTDPLKQQAEESVRLLEAIDKREGDIWVLDERGKAMTSPAFASSLGALSDAGRTAIFVLGGAYGLTDAVRKRTNRLLKLSDMTFPHELCRLIFLEQLYRATEINKGSGYHHA